MREDAGEIEAALAGLLPPRSSRFEDLQRRPAQPTLIGPMALHSDRGHGERHRRRGHAYQVLTDHSRFARHRPRPDAGASREERVSHAPSSTPRYAAEEAAGTAPPETPAEGFRLLRQGLGPGRQGDGALDYDDDLLASLRPRRRLRPRLASADSGGTHPATPQRDPIAARGRHRPPVRSDDQPERDDLDLDWDAVYAEAARTGTALEMNGSPHRLDLAVAFLAWMRGDRSV